MRRRYAVFEVVGDGIDGQVEGLLEHLWGRRRDVEKCPAKDWTCHSSEALDSLGVSRQCWYELGILKM